MKLRTKFSTLVYSPNLEKPYDLKCYLDNNP